SDRGIAESDYLNNHDETHVTMTRLPNLALDRPRLKATQEYVQHGDIVGITVPYLNDSDFDFANPFAMEIRARGPNQQDVTLYRTSFPRLDAGEGGLIQAAWRADGSRDSIYISINEDREY